MLSLVSRTWIHGMYILVVYLVNQGSAVCRHEKKGGKLIFYVGCSASAIWIWSMIVHLQRNSRRSFHGSSMHCHLLIVQRVAMGHIPIAWIWRVWDWHSKSYFVILNASTSQLAEHLKVILLFLNYFQVMREVFYKHLSFEPITPHLINKYSSHFLSFNSQNKLFWEAPLFCSIWPSFSSGWLCELNASCTGVQL